MFSPSILLSASPAQAGVAEPIPLLMSGKGSHPSISQFTLQCIWRRERDSNPRSRFCRNTRFPVVPLRPLGHLSVLLLVSYSNLLVSIYRLRRERGMYSLTAFAPPPPAKAGVAEPSVPILSEHTISSRAPSASRASLHDFTFGEILLTFNYLLSTC